MTQDELQACYEQADTRMKATDGHSYITVLKTRCQHCGRSPNQKGRCSGWFNSFIDNLTVVMIERGHVQPTSSDGDE